MSRRTPIPNTACNPEVEVATSPHLLTKPAIRYFLEADRMHDLHSFLGSIVGAVDIPRILLEAESEKIWYGEYVGKPHEIDVEAITTPVSPARILDSFSEFLSEISLCRSADNFLGYISELLTELFLTREETLNAYSKRQFTVEDLLRVRSREELLSVVAHKIVRGYAYSSFYELEKQLNERHGLVLAELPGDSESMSELIGTRNILVHNRGVVNEDYLQHVPSTKRALGEAVEVDWIASGNLQRAADRIVIAIDSRAAKKFSLAVEQVPDSCLTSVLYAGGHCLEMLERTSGARRWLDLAARDKPGPFSFVSNQPDPDQPDDSPTMEAEEACRIVRELVAWRWDAFKRVSKIVEELNSPAGQRRQALEALERLESTDPNTASRARALVDTHPRLVILIGMGNMTIDQAEQQTSSGTPDKS